MTSMIRPAGHRAFGLAAIVALLGLIVPSTGCATRQERAGDAYFRAVDARQAGHQKQAIQDLEQATQLNPDFTVAHSLLGDLYQSNGNLPGAAREYEQTARLSPRVFNNFYRLGFVYQLLNRLQDAAAAYLRALELRPNDTRTNVNLGSVYLALNQYDDAIKYLRRATELDPKMGAAWANLGVAYDLQGNAPSAELSYKRAIELPGAQPAIILNLGLNLLAQGKAGEAAQVLGEAVKQMNTPFARQRLADALAQSRRYDEALKQYDAALELDPNYFPALNAKATALIRQYQQGLELDDTVRQQAVDNWKQSLSINPSQPRVQQQLTRWDAKQTARPTTGTASGGR